MSFESAKKYGFIASIINVIMPIAAIVMLAAVFTQLVYNIIDRQELSTSWIGTFTGYIIVACLVGITGLILFLLAMYKLSGYYAEPKIFRYVLYGFLIPILGSIIISIITVLLIAATVGFDASSVPTVGSTLFTGVSVTIVAVTIVAVTLIFAVIQGILYWKAFTKLGEASDVDSFKTAGTLFLIGSITSVIGIGVILCWVSWIFAAEGYRKLQPKPVVNNVVTDYTVAATVASSISGRVFCSYCGIENDVGSGYCKQCGKPLHTDQVSI